MPAGLGVATRSLFRGSIPPEAPDRPPYVSREENRKISACCQEGGEEIFGGAAAYASGSAGGEAPNWRTALSHAFAQPSAAPKSASSVSAGSEMKPPMPAPTAFAQTTKSPSCSDADSSCIGKPWLFAPSTIDLPQVNSAPICSVVITPPRSA